MPDEQDLPPGFKAWPPADWKAFQKEVDDTFTAAARGRHWGLQVFCHNPISGYKVVAMDWQEGHPK
jgi:hypothetical protein